MGEPPREQPKRLITLRLRLTLWVMVISAVVQLTVAFVGLLFQANSVRRLYDDQLQLRAGKIIESLPLNPGDVVAEQLQQLAQLSSLQVFFDRVRIAVFDMDMNPVAFDPMMPPPDRPKAVQQAIATGTGAFSDWTPVATIGDNKTYEANRTYAHPITAGEASPPGLVLWIATSDEYADQRVRSVRWAVTLTTLAGMLGSAIAGWFIAGIAVRPIEQIRSAVRNLTPGQTSMESSDEFEDPEVTRLRGELDDAVTRIEAGYAAYGRFIANVSHELKTPIAVALTESQVLLNNEQLDQKARDFAESVAEEMSRLGRLVESFLTLTRVREGKLKTSLRDYPVNELIMDSVEHCWSFAQQRQVTLSPNLLDGVETAEICVDPDLMRTAVDNLIRNAIRFSPVAGRVEIVASLTDDRANAVISVRDYGPGIPENLLPTIFDRFAQSDSEKRSGRGTGLGLEIAQGIAEIHEGHISVANLEEGCVFALSIPLATSDDECPELLDENE